MMGSERKSLGNDGSGEMPGEILLIRKPPGWTSFDVVRKVRSILGVRKAGHAGTLDPLATGILIIGTGRMTKELDRYQEMEKEYRVVMRLGERTESLDSDTPVTETSPYTDVSEQRFRSVLPRFEGEQTQLPPMYSALKVKGRPLYKYARKGQIVERKERRVMIRSITLDGFLPPEVTLTVVCSKGTYIRSLVDDIGNELGCGAHVTALERTRIGDYRIGDALSLEDLMSRSVSPGRA